MNKEKIAIMTDTCCDVPKAYAEKYGIYVIPVRIIYGDKEYHDGVDISPQEVYSRLAQEIPKTSLPSGAEVMDVFRRIRKDGYEKVICITLSSGLSGTNNMMKLMANEVNDLEVEVIDTKNIAIGSGFSVIQAAKLVQQGLGFEEIISRIEDNLMNSHVYFVVDTLEYLKHGGRIGLVASLFGNAFHIRPVISCNDDGIYYTVAKVRGRKKSIEKMKEIAMKEAKRHRKIFFAVCNGDAEKEANEVIESTRPFLENIEEFIEGEISPSLGINTGPGIIGIGVYKVE